MTIEQLSKKTKLSVSTIRVYTPKMKLGKKVGNRRVYSEADIAKLTKGSKKPDSKKTSKPTAKKATKKVATKRATKKTAMHRAVVTTKEVPAPTAPKSSFWNRVFGGNKKEKKISLVDAKLKK